MQAPVVVPADQTQQEQRSWDYTYVALGFFVGLLFSPVLAGVALCCASFIACSVLVSVEVLGLDI
ncbi:hypothetical protein HDU79_005865 [Rhizoclosmatium sp. JEL0117]|nr:hypothetical protein HDU79_005865 [Rhizoclosmatium sp. JEL0117]